RNEWNGKRDHPGRSGSRLGRLRTADHVRKRQQEKNNPPRDPKIRKRNPKHGKKLEPRDGERHRDCKTHDHRHIEYAIALMARKARRHRNEERKSPDDIECDKNSDRGEKKRLKHLS